MFGIDVMNYLWCVVGIIISVVLPIRMGDGAPLLSIVATKRAG